MKSPNWQEARVFVDRIAGRSDPAMTFQVFDDKGERYELAAWRHGKLSDPSIRSWLAKKADSGCGVYVVVSACDGKGRRRQNVKYARASFIDLDGEPLPDTWEVEPDIINETSPGKYHCFWLIQNEDDLNAWSDCQARLAAFYTADPKVFDPPRVVRLPGFYHQKNPDAVFRSKTLKICDADAADAFERKQLSDITSKHDVEYHAPAERAEGGRSDEPAHGWDDPVDVANAKEYLKTVKRPQIGNRNNAGYAVAAVLNDFGISPELSFDLMREIWNPRLPEELEDHELRHVIKSAGRYKEKSAGALSTSNAADDFEDATEEELDFEVAAEDEPTAEAEFAEFMETPKKPADTEQFDFEPAEELSFEGETTLPAKTIKREVGGVSWSFGHEIKAEPITWLWPWRIPRGKLTLVVGYPDQGKSQILLKIAALVTKGGDWPADEGQAPEGVAIILSSEDDEADTLIPRLAAAEAYLPNIVVVRPMVKYVDEGRKRKRVLNIDDDLGQIKSIIKKLHDEGRRVQMIGLDPINAYFGGAKKADSYKTSDMRAILTPLSEWAATLKVAIVAISHFNKGNAQHGLHRITDSAAIGAAARSVYATLRADPEDKESDRIFAPMKHNLAPDKVAAITYDLKSADVSEQTGVPNPKYGTPYVEFGVASDVTAEMAMNGAKAGRKPDALETARDFLEKLLDDGPMLAKDLEAECKAASQSISTIRRAADQLGIVKDRAPAKNTKNGPWRWSLPDAFKPIEDERGPSDDDQEDTGSDMSEPDADFG